MLFKQSTLAAIAGGRVTLAFRRWPRPRVRAGSSLTTALGVVRVVSVEPVAARAIGDEDARQAGYPSRAALLAELARYPGGRIYRIGLAHGGADPRIALRARARLGAGERDALEARIARLGARTAGGRWALPILRLIGRRPATRAAALAEAIGMDTARFKARVRQLKNLGLTESLGTGYRLSPRGDAILRGMRGR